VVIKTIPKKKKYKKVRVVWGRREGKAKDKRKDIPL